MTLPRTPSFRLDGKRALVTGGTSGIGLGCAVALAEHGASVTLAARNTDRMTAAAAKMRAEGWAVDTLSLDVSDIADTQSKVAQSGPYDILVNSAGFARHAPALETTESDFDAMTDLNAKGAYFIAQAVAKGLVAAGKPGSIIQISSQMAHVGGQERAVYCGSKHAVEGYTKAQAIEWGPSGIRVNTICPTFIRTPLTEQTFKRPELVAWIEDKIKLGRIGEVEDIMGATVFLASDAAALITGTSLLVDGGWTAD
ncbi:SDR family oxidoreductase [Roseobacter sp. N2S]|uniref:SDR family NAD(P)-dependent oxidoreductase n=1 Tax=Roseobacter sp. N2S TaxID=2663844 RepID=UPI00285D1A94|nr:SDR family oxidoreductase [Roseobacter sp. N2S]MDR6263588.1 NAD(P)-dependent dehydrogenase (short-subunit alcohol dehydrogenase family) [Roseobacter sp. N2S]